MRFNIIWLWLFIGPTFLFSSELIGQKTKLVTGNLDFLEHISILDLEFDFSDPSVGKYKKEKDYVILTVSKKNEKKLGSGNEWKTAWFENRAEHYQPIFEKSLNYFLLRGSGISISQEFNEAGFKIILKTNHIEPGINLGIGKPTHINVEFIFVEKVSNRELARIEMLKVPGSALGSDYDFGVRLAQTYQRCGVELAKFLNNYHSE